jgi:hypothetical protein
MWPFLFRRIFSTFVQTTKNMPFIILNPPTKRRKKKNGEFLLIREDQTWQNNIEVFCFTDGGCISHPSSDAHEMEDGAIITIYNGFIDEISE